MCWTDLNASLPVTETLMSAVSDFSLNNMEELLMVERAAFQNLPEIVKLELCNNPQLSYMDPQAFRYLSIKENMMMMMMKV